MMRDLILDFRRGGGSVPEVVHGIVRIWGTEVRPNATSLVLTTETTLKLSEGKASLANAQTSGTGPLYEWAYIIQVEPFHGRNYRFYVAIPDGTGPINLVDLPKLNPITGEGFYLDIEEWEALYGDLPNRVDALESSQGTQNTQIAALQTGKANTSHTHVIGDVTGLQPALNAKGNATMRVDTTVGTRVFITDGVTERMVSGDTGWRNVSPLFVSILGTTVAPGTDYGVHIRRMGEVVYWRIKANTVTTANTNSSTIPTGFHADGIFVSELSAVNAATTRVQLQISVNNIFFLWNNVPANSRVTGTFITTTSGAWPTTLPGTPA